MPIRSEPLLFRVAVLLASLTSMAAIVAAGLIRLSMPPADVIGVSARWAGLAEPDAANVRFAVHNRGEDSLDGVPVVVLFLDVRGCALFKARVFAGEGVPPGGVWRQPDGEVFKVRGVPQNWDEGRVRSRPANTGR